MILECFILENVYTKVDEKLQEGDNMEEKDGLQIRILPKDDKMDWRPPPVEDSGGSPFYEELTTKPENYKYFKCKHGDWNIVKPDEVLPMKHLAKESKLKKVIHMELNKDIAIQFKKFSKNFGNYNATIAILMNNFHKYNH